MQEERKMILEMLSDKKITADEAAELLRVLGGPEPASDTGPARPAASQTEPRSSGEPGRGAGRSILEDFLGKLDINWGNLPFAFGGESYRYDEEHKGDFAPDKDVVLDLLARNGRVEVFGTDETGWRVVIRKKIRAQDEARARQIAAEIASFTAGPDKLTFEEHTIAGANSGVSIEVYVPKDAVREIRARSSNGRVIVENLECAELHGKTANGKVAVQGVSARSADLATTNGGITFEGACDELECSTANGQINLCPQPVGDMRCLLHTSNGSIRVRVPHRQDVGYRIDARTGHGSLQVGLAGFDVSHEEKQFGRRRLRGQSAGYDDKAIKVDLKARTTNGSIKFGVQEPGDVSCSEFTSGGDEDEERTEGQ